MQWNKGQWEAITHLNGPALVLAGPGSGKTAVIVNHVKFLLESGVPGHEILVLTFTRAAAEEMRERFSRLVPEEKRVTFGTFHAVCFHILKEECGYTQKSLLREEEKRRLLKEVLFRLGILQANAEVQIERLLAEIGRRKSMPRRSVDETTQDPDFPRIFMVYQKRLAAEKRLDFDDLVGYCYELLQKDERMRQRWQRRFRCFLVDEYQDLNGLQTDWVRLLAGPTGHVFAVGDEDQSIYRFRGADPSGMLAFEVQYPGARRITLAVNYRSVPEILKPAGKLIANNRERFPKKIKAARSGGDLAVDVRCYEDAEAGNRDIVQEMERLRAAGIPWKDMAVLYRSIGTARGLMQRLADRQIPFTCKEIPEEAKGDWAVQDMEAYRNLAREKHWRRRDLLRVLNHPDRGLPRTGLERERVEPQEWLAQFRGVDGYESAARELVRTVTRLKQMDAFAAVRYLWRGAGYGDYVRTVCREKEVSEATIRKRVEDWVLRQETAEQEMRDGWGRSRGSEDCSRETSDSMSERPTGVAIMTMHASKGLEFSVVFLPECNEGVIPHSRAHSERELEEERRLMYVAVTRAKDHLYLSWVKRRRERPLRMSQFVKEMGVPIPRNARG